VLTRSWNNLHQAQGQMIGKPNNFKSLYKEVNQNRLSFSQSNSTILSIVHNSSCKVLSTMRELNPNMHIYTVYFLNRYKIFTNVCPITIIILLINSGFYWKIQFLNTIIIRYKVHIHQAYWLTLADFDCLVWVFVFLASMDF
jgi:hypothetical protein